MRCWTGGLFPVWGQEPACGGVLEGSTGSSPSQGAPVSRTRPRRGRQAAGLHARLCSMNICAVCREQLPVNKESVRATLLRGNKSILQVFEFSFTVGKR